MRGKRKLLQCGIMGILFVATSGYGTIAKGQAGFTLVDTRPLVRFGPVDPATGFPIWAEGVGGIKAELCLDTTLIPDPLAPLDPAAACPVCIDPNVELPDPLAPVSFPDNFPEEAFYMQATALMETNAGGRALLVLALEAAFDGLGVVQDGEQIVFSRARIRVDNLDGMSPYTITHPYGIVNVEATGPGVRGVNLSNDVFLWKQNLGGNLSGLVGNFGSFLTSDVVTIGPEFFGDPCGDGPISGSPFGTNVFRIEGPNIGDVGSPFLCKDALGNVTPTAGGPDDLSTTDCVETKLFTIIGKNATRFGVNITRATYNRDASATQVDIWATSSNTAALEASCVGIGSMPMVGDGNGNFYAHMAVTSAVEPPPIVTVINVSDIPASSSTAPLTDAVAIPVATYNLDAVDALGNPSPTLVVTAASSRTGGGGAGASLSLSGGAPVATGAGGSLTTSVSGVNVPPTTIDVASSFGGFVEVPVVVISTVTTPLAAAGVNQVANFGATVTLDGSGSTGIIDTHTWAQVANGAPTVVLTPDPLNPAVATFTMPLGPAEVLFEFTLTVASTAGTGSASITVTNPIIANAGLDQAVVGGDIVTLDGCASTTVLNDLSWAQTAGAAVVLSNPLICNPTFSFPIDGGTVAFALTVSGPAGSLTDTVTVTGTVGTPVANAGQTLTLFTGELVQLDGGQSQGAIDTWTWTQLVGPLPPVTLGILLPGGGVDTTSGSNVPNPVFFFPNNPQVMTMQLVVSGPGGVSAASTVDITGADVFVPDTISAPKADYGAGKGDWRIEGTSSIPGPGATVTFYLGDPFPGNAIGTGAIDAGGRFKVQSPQNSPQDPTVPGAPQTMTAVSTNGGIATNVPFTIK